MFQGFGPRAALSAAALAAAGIAIVLIIGALGQPWLGLRLAADETGAIRIASVHPRGPGAVLPGGAQLLSLRSASGETIALEAADLVEEPDVAPSYRALARFFERQDALSRALREGRVTLALADGRSFEIAPRRSRPIADLPAVFWAQLGVGLASFLIGAWIWSLRRAELSARLLALGGLFILTFSCSAAFYSTREIALDGGAFRALSSANHFGALGFGASMIALFLVYPRFLVRPRLLLALPLLFGGWWAADALRLGFDGPAEGHHLPTVIEMAGIFLAALLQRWKAKRDPMARAALRWFSLSVVVGAGSFVALVIAPNLVGAAPRLSQGYGFLLFLLVYSGVAAGVARYRLFDLDDWSFRILFYVSAAGLLIGLDAALIALLEFDQSSALGLAIVAVALFYLPFRDYLLRRVLMRPRRFDRVSLFGGVMDVALTPVGAARNEAWSALLCAAFDPLRVEGVEDAGLGGADIAEHGVALCVPEAGGAGALKLAHAYGGRRLFSPRDAALARELSAMLDHAVASREAYEKGVAEERARIARDMHDHIGAQLLSALQSPASERKDARIREALADVRAIVNDAARGAASLEDALAELRFEAAERLAEVGIALDWGVEGEASRLTPEGLHALRAILREATSNVIRHSGARVMSVRIALDERDLTLGIEDDGRGLDPSQPAAGHGLANIRARVAALGGEIAVETAAPGARIRAAWPIRRVALTA